MPILCTTTLLPNRDPVDGPTVLSLADAAAAAGFDGVWIWDMHHAWAVADGVSSEQFVDHYRSAGLRFACVEVVMDWAAPEDSPASQHTIEVAAAVAADTIIALTPGMPPIAQAAGRLAALCDRAADRGLGVCVEPVPWHGVSDVGVAAELFDATGAGQPRAGARPVALAARRHRPDLDALRRFPAERVAYVQFDDAAAEPWPDALPETLTARLLPGDGVVDIAAVLDVLDDGGATPQMASEVFSTGLLADLGPEKMAAAQFDAMQAILAPRQRN